MPQRLELGCQLSVFHVHTPTARARLREGVCHETLDVGESIADGLLGEFGRLPFEICRRTVNDTFLVDDGEIVEAMAAFQQEEQVMVEPASSVGLAAMLSGKIEVQNRKVVLVVTSRNIDASRYNQLIQKRIRSG